jgi:hypothetical protein
MLIEAIWAGVGLVVALLLAARGESRERSG